MAAIASIISDFYNKAQNRIYQYGQELVDRKTNGYEYDFEITAISELSAGISLLQDARNDQTTNQKYEVIHYLSKKYDLNKMPLAYFQESALINQTIVISMGGVTSFLALSDTPKAYVAGKRLETTSTGIIFVDNFVDILFADLVVKINAGTLEAGASYRITDYQTKHIVPNDTITNIAAAVAMGATVAVEPLVVTTDSATTLRPQAFSPTNPNDIIWYDVTKVLCEDGTTARNGFITRRIDTSTNQDAPHDFRACYWLREKINSTTHPNFVTATSRSSSFSFTNADPVVVLSGAVSYPIQGTGLGNTVIFSDGDVLVVGSGTCTYNGSPYTIGQTFTIATGTGLQFTGSGTVGLLFTIPVGKSFVISTAKGLNFIGSGAATKAYLENAIIFVTGTGLFKALRPTASTSGFTDTDWVKLISVTNNEYWLTSASTNVAGSTISADTSAKAYFKTFGTGTFKNITIEAKSDGTLSNTVFLNGGGKNFKLGPDAYDQTIDGTGSNSVFFEGNSHGNILDRGISNFRVGPGINNNSFGASISNLYIGKDATGNAIGEGCNSITVKGTWNSNKIGKSSQWYTCGQDAEDNVLGHGNNDVTMEDNVYHNKLGTSVTSSKFTNGSYSNDVGDSCSSIDFYHSSLNFIGGCLNLSFQSCSALFLRTPGISYANARFENITKKVFTQNLSGGNIVGAANATDAAGNYTTYTVAIPADTISQTIDSAGTLWSVLMSTAGLPSFYNLRTGATVALPGGAGSVTSVDVALPTSVFSASSGAITAAGTITFTFNTQTANRVFAGPTTGSAAAPTFRALVAADIPSLSSVYLPLSGGTLTGALTLSADAASSLQPVTLQQMNAALVGLWDDRGNYDASGNAYPSSGGSGTAGAILKGDIWTISVAGTLPTGQVVEPGDTVRALVDTPGSTQSNWAIAQNNIGYTPLTSVLTSTKIFVGNSSNVATGVNLTLSGSSGAFALSNTGVLTMLDAATGARGLLNSTDWNTFNNKTSSQWVTTGSDIYYSTGNVMIGNASAPSSKLHVVETGTSIPRGITSDQYNTGASGVEENYRKARGSLASPTTIVVGDTISGVSSWAHDGTSFNRAARILVTSVGTIGTGRTPTKMELQTMTDITTGVLTTALTLDQAQTALFASTVTIPALTLTLASTATGDMYYNGGSGVVTRLAAVAVGSYLRSNGVTSAPVWSTLILPNAATANQVVVATSTNTYGGSTGLTYSSNNLQVGVSGSAANGTVTLVAGTQNNAFAGFEAYTNGTALFEFGVNANGGGMGGTLGNTNGRYFYWYDYISAAYRGGIGPTGLWYFGGRATPTAQVHVKAPAATTGLRVEQTSGTANVLEIGDNSTGVLASFNSTGWLGIGVAATASLHVTQNISAAAWTTSGIGVRVGANTYTDTSSATGTVATMYSHTIGAPTFIASNTGVIYTNVGSLFIDAPLASTNVTITNPYALILGGNLRIVMASGALINASANLTIQSGSASNSITFQQGGSTRYSIAATTANHSWAGVAQSSGTTAFATFTQSVNTGGANPGFLWTAGAHTSQTTATEVIDINFNLSAVMKMVDGTVATQRTFLIQGRTYTPQTTALTLTTAVTLDITPPIAGSGTTITNNYAFRSSGKISITDTTEATSATVASSIFAGGVGINKKLFVTGDTAIAGIASVTNSTTSTSTSTGSLVNSGGFGNAGTAWIGGATNITDTTASTSITTGSLIVGGGAGIAGYLYALINYSNSGYFMAQPAAGSSTTWGYTVFQTGTNLAGPVFGLQSGYGTGNGTGSTIAFFTSTPTTSGTANHGVAQRGQIDINGLVITVDFKITTAGKGIYIKEGSNARMGTGTLIGGTATISNTSITANTRVFCFDTNGASLTNVGTLAEDLTARVVSTSFKINSTNVLDTSTFNWILFEPS